MYQILREDDYREVMESMQEIEDAKDDSHRMLKVIPAIKKLLVVETGEGTTLDPDTQVDIIITFFEEMFGKRNIAGLPPIEISTTLY